MTISTITIIAGYECSNGDLQCNLVTTFLSSLPFLVVTGVLYLAAFLFLRLRKQIKNTFVRMLLLLMAAVLFMGPLLFAANFLLENYRDHIETSAKIERNNEAAYRKASFTVFRPTYMPKNMKVENVMSLETPGRRSFDIYASDKENTISIDMRPIAEIKNPEDECDFFGIRFDPCVVHDERKSIYRLEKDRGSYTDYFIDIEDVRLNISANISNEELLNVLDGLEKVE